LDIFEAKDANNDELVHCRYYL